MKTLFTLFFIGWQCLALAQDRAEELDRLYRKNRYVAMEQYNATDTSHPHYYFYKAAFANACNKAALSNLYLDTLEQRGVPDKLGYLLLKLRNDNYVKLFRYADAAAMGKLMLERYDTLFSEQNKADLTNVTNIWEAAKEVPPVTFANFSEIDIAYTRDRAELISIEVETYDTTVNFILDTGAGMCAISESMAKTLGFKILESKPVAVEGYTDVANQVRIAVAPAIFIGNVCIKNMLFLVVSDASMSFHNNEYKVNGIIGLPVAMNMGTVVIGKDSLTFKSGENCALADKNLFIDFLNPVLFLGFNGDKQPYNLDTGASESTFSAPFYYYHKKILRRIGGKLRWGVFASVGGSRTYRIFVMKALTLQLGKQDVVFSPAIIEKDARHPMGINLFGNIGQDLLQQYRKVHISFDGNYLKLEK